MISLDRDHPRCTHSSRTIPRKFFYHVSYHLLGIVRWNRVAFPEVVSSRPRFSVGKSSLDRDSSFRREFTTALKLCRINSGKEDSARATAGGVSARNFESMGSGADMSIKASRRFRTNVVRPSVGWNRISISLIGVKLETEWLSHSRINCFTLNVPWYNLWPRVYDTCTKNEWIKTQRKVRITGIVYQNLSSDWRLFILSLCDTYVCRCY